MHFDAIVGIYIDDKEVTHTIRVRNYIGTNVRPTLTSGIFATHAILVRNYKDPMLL